MADVNSFSRPSTYSSARLMVSSETFEAVTGFTVAGDGPIIGTAFPFPCWELEVPIAIGCGILFFVIVCDLSVVGVALASAISQCVSAFLILRALTRLRIMNLYLNF